MKRKDLTEAPFLAPMCNVRTCTNPCAWRPVAEKDEKTGKLVDKGKGYFTNWCERHAAHIFCVRGCINKNSKWPCSFGKMN